MKQLETASTAIGYGLYCHCRTLRLHTGTELGFELRGASQSLLFANFCQSLLFEDF